MLEVLTLYSGAVGVCDLKGRVQHTEYHLGEGRHGEKDDPFSS